MSFIYEEQLAHPLHVLLVTTDSCNLACRYCFVEQHPHFMSFDIAKAAVDWIITNYKWRENNGFLRSDETPSVYFFGGEPMLMYESIIVPTVNYCHEQYPDFKFIFGMTTNGTLLDEEKILWLKKHNFYILLSIDGDKPTQDYNRPCQDLTKSSFDLLKPNLPILVRLFKDLTFRSTIYPDTVEYLYDNYLFAESLGFTWYYAMPDGRHPWAEDKINILKEQMSLIFLYRLNQYLDNIKPMHFSTINEMFELILQRDEQFLLHQDLTKKLPPNQNIYRCGLGVNGCAIGYDGNLYGCQEQPSKGKDSFFYIGNLIKDHGINKDEHSRLLTFYINRGNLICENNQLCSPENCPLYSVCYLRDCPSTAYDLFKDFNTENLIRCIWKQILFENCTTTMYILTNKNCTFFKDYLNKLEIFNKYQTIIKGG